VKNIFEKNVLSTLKHADKEPVVETVLNIGACSEDEEGKHFFDGAGKCRTCGTLDPFRIFNKES
jgi:hypothetical protein